MKEQTNIILKKKRDGFHKDGCTSCVSNNRCVKPSTEFLRPLERQKFDFGSRSFGKSNIERS